MINKVFPLFLVVMIGLGLIGTKQVIAETSPKDGATLKHLVHDVVSHDVEDFVEHFYQAKSRLFVFLNDGHWAIERQQSGIYLISVHIETYQKLGAFPLGRDILTIKIDPKEMNRFFGNPKPRNSDGHGIHIVHCQHQIPEVNQHKVTFSSPKEVKGKFCQ